MHSTVSAVDDFQVGSSLATQAVLILDQNVVSVAAYTANMLYEGRGERLAIAEHPGEARCDVILFVSEEAEYCFDFSSVISQLIGHGGVSILGKR